jgi:hypothetical protein
LRFCQKIDVSFRWRAWPEREGETRSYKKATGGCSETIDLDNEQSVKSQLAGEAPYPGWAGAGPSGQSSCVLRAETVMMSAERTPNDIVGCWDLTRE